MKGFWAILVVYHFFMQIDSKSLADFIHSQDWSSFAVVEALELQVALAKHEGLFERWVANGYQADMDYLEGMKEDRFHP